MSWITQLCETYENLRTNEELLKGCDMPLLPVSHTVQTSHAEIFIDRDGNFIRAEGIPRDKSLTIVPCTEASGGRSSGIAPHILYDNIKYVGGNQTEYTGDEKTLKYYKAYIEQLGEWCDREDCPNEVRSIYNYVSKGRVISDLINSALLFKGENGLSRQWGGDKDNKPANALNTFVRFRVEEPDGSSVECNSDSRLHEAYTRYDRSRREKMGLCFVTGEKAPITYKHPSKIRYSGDSAKLISANDSSGFTFRGRFDKPDEVFAVGYEASEKAHSALRWLIRNQGFVTGNQTVVIWSVRADPIPPASVDTTVLFGDEEELYNKYTPLDSYAEAVRRAVNGYRHGDLEKPLENNTVAVMIVEAATLGRLSVKYYREIQKSDYLDNIEYWHQTCVWNHSYKSEKTEIGLDGGSKKQSVKYIKFTGAPSLDDIIYAAYGDKVDDNLKKRITEILISCVCERKRIPRDIVMKAFVRASNSSGMSDGEANKTTSVACAMIKKYYKEYERKEYDMALDCENRDRSYLFGRVLAYAERIEAYALYKGGEKRVPNARKLRGKYRMQPARTLMILDDKLEPYVQKLYTDGNWLYSRMQEVISLINERDFMNNKPLEPSFLLGYASQMAEFSGKNDTADEETNRE